MGTFIRELRYTLRQFWAARIFTATAILTLALGIGGTTAIFTLIHAVMLRSLPVGDPSRLYRIGDGDTCCVQGGPQDRWGMVSYALFERLKAETPEFEEVTAFQAGGARVSVRRQDVDTTPRPLRSEYVTGNYFSTLGVNAFAGRVFSVADDTPAAPPAIVLSYHAWQGTYGGDPAIVGATFVIEGHAFTVAGVTPPGFFGDTLRADPPDLWIPLQQEPLINGETSILRQPVSAWLRVIGRLRPGATTDGMSARLTAVLHQWMQHESGYPANWMPDVIQSLPQQVMTVVPAGAGVGIMKEQYGRSLQILLGVCALVLLIACANVANLLLARAVARRGQTAIRLAMGASRRQIVTEALVESILLAVAGAIAGLVVAVGAARLLLSLAFAGATILPIATTPSPMVLAFASALALVTGIVFGAAPAWFATRTDPIDALRGAGRSTGDHSSVARTTLLIVQATVSVVLVAGSAMLARSLGNLEGQDFGFEVDGRVVVALNRPPASYTPEKVAALNRDLQARLNRLPGVQGAGLALYNPLTDNWGELVLVAGHPAPAPGEQAGASWDRVSTNYLQHLGVKLVRGRYFTDADNETTGERRGRERSLCPALLQVHRGSPRSALRPQPAGKRQHLPHRRHRARRQVRGLRARPPGAADVLRRPRADRRLHEHVDEAYRVAVALRAWLLLVTDSPPGTLEPQVKRALAEADPDLTVTSVRTLRQQVERSFDQQRAVASLAGSSASSPWCSPRSASTVSPCTRDTADERDRSPHGARRRSRERHWHCPARGVSPRRRRPRARAAARGGRWLLALGELYGVSFWIQPRWASRPRRSRRLRSSRLSFRLHARRPFADEGAAAE